MSVAGPQVSHSYVQEQRFLEAQHSQMGSGLFPAPPPTDPQRRQLAHQSFIDQYQPPPELPFGSGWTGSPHGRQPLRADLAKASIPYYHDSTVAGYPQEPMVHHQDGIPQHSSHPFPSSFECATQVDGIAPESMAPMQGHDQQSSDNYPVNRYYHQGSAMDEKDIEAAFF